MFQSPTAYTNPRLVKLIISISGPASHMSLQKQTFKLSSSSKHSNVTVRSGVPSRFQQKSKFRFNPGLTQIIWLRETGSRAGLNFWKFCLAKKFRTQGSVFWQAQSQAGQGSNGNFAFILAAPRPALHSLHIVMFRLGRKFMLVFILYVSPKI